MLMVRQLLLRLCDGRPGSAAGGLGQGEELIAHIEEGMVPSAAAQGKVEDRAVEPKGLGIGSCRYLRHDLRIRRSPSGARYTASASEAHPTNQSISGTPLVGLK